MSGDHSHGSGEHSHGNTPPPVAANRAKYLIVEKEGNAYFPDNPSYYVGGDIYTVLASAQNTGGPLAVLDFYVPPHDVFPQHIHANEAEAKYLLDGNVNFQFGTANFDAPTGTFVYYAIGTQMGFTAKNEPARMLVSAIPGANYYQLAGVPLIDAQGNRIAPPDADLATLQAQVNLGKVAQINQTYGGKLVIPGVPTPPTPGLLDRVVVVPDNSVPDSELAALEAVPGVKVYEESERRKFTGAFGTQNTSLVDFSETNGILAYSKFSLDKTVNSTPNLFLANLEAIAPNTSTANGLGNFTFKPTSTSLEYSLKVTGLDFGVLSNAPQTPDTQDDVTSVQIHQSSGVFNILQDPDLKITKNPDNSTTVSGVWNPTDAPLPDVFTNRLPGESTELSVDVHTVGKPSGEISGKIVATSKDFAAPIVSSDHQTIYVTEGKLSLLIDGKPELATPDTFVYISPGQEFSIKNFGDTKVTGIESQTKNNYVPKIGEYFDDLYVDLYAGYKNDFPASILNGNEYTQGKIISTNPQQIGNDPSAWIYTWGAFNDSQQPLSIGISFTEAALNDVFSAAAGANGFPRLVPHLGTKDGQPPNDNNQYDPSRVFDLVFPNEVSKTTPFNHMGFYANSEGHAPTHIYDTPHLDVHFFTIPLEERNQITGYPVGAPGGTNSEYANLPPEGFLNSDYLAPTIPNSNIPATADALQGIHWVDKDTPELNGGEFGQTFIFGSYAGKVNFWEPMITKEFLAELGLAADGTKTTKKITFDIKQPERFAKAGLYPQKYSIVYDADHREYTVSLDLLTYQEPDFLLRFGSKNDDDSTVNSAIEANGADIVFAGNGNDIVDASQSKFGGNRLYGAKGEDELTGGKSDRLFGGADKDIIDTTQGTTSSGGGKNRSYGGDGDDEIYVGFKDRAFGGKGNDTIDASQGEGQNRLYGGDGDDELIAGSDDQLFGGDGNDTLIAGRGGATLVGGGGVDTFVLTQAELPEQANNVKDFDAATEVLVIAGLDLTLEDLDLTQDGKDVVITADGKSLGVIKNLKVADLKATNFSFEETSGGGGTGSGSNNGGGNNNGGQTPASSEQVASVQGGQTLTGTLGADNLYGNTGGGNTFDGKNGDDNLYAGKGGDTAKGGPGADVLVGGLGNDTFNGGDGNDAFVFQKEFAVTVKGNNLTIGGYGGNDVIEDFQARAGSGDIIRLRNLDNGTGIAINGTQTGDTVITISDRINVEPGTGASGNGTFVPKTLQTITLKGVTPGALMTQGQIEVNGQPLNETTQGLTKIPQFGAYDYVVGGLNSNFPTRPGGSVGNFVLGDLNFGQPGVPIENNLITGDFVSNEKIAATLKKIAQAFPNGIKLPGTDDPNLTPEKRAELEAKKIIGTIPTALLPQNAFSFAFNEQGEVDLSKFTRSPVPTTTGDDTAIGGPGNDFIITGPGNDIVVGGPGTDLIWAGIGQDIVVGRQGVDYIIFDSILDFRDRDKVEEDAISNAVPDARIGYIREEEAYGTPLVDPLTGAENPFTSKTGPDIFFINSEAFNRGINDGNVNGQNIGFLKPGTIITGDGTGPAGTKNGQLHIGVSTVPNSDGPASDDLQPTFYYSPNAGRMFFDRDGIGAQFEDFWMADMAQGNFGLPDGSPSAAAQILLAIY
ncbi:Na-Ca exchanger/integrin-beta4 [Calothrix brevissima NIES-22]|nr:Na-Ca exchanger/integrin-beta4 [Calothrix brevissima NIES-22]